MAPQPTPTLDDRAAQAHASNWITAFYSGRPWEQLATPDAQPTIAQVHADTFAGIPEGMLGIDRIDWRDTKHADTQWTGTADVTFFGEPVRMTTITVTIDTDSGEPLVSGVDLISFGQSE